MNTITPCQFETGPIAMRVEGIWKSFAGTTVLRGVTFELGQGEILGIVGPSGGGKTTLLRCLNLLESPDRGLIEYEEGFTFSKDFRKGEASGRKSMAAHLRSNGILRQHVGMVFQSLNLWEEKTVLQNLTLAPRVVLGMSVKQAEAEALDFCQQFGLNRKVHSRVWMLSGGEKQRVAIVRALLMRPKILLLDEITSALDPILTVNIMDVIRDLRGRGMAMVLVTHHVQFASSLCDRLMFLDEGQVVQLDTPAAFVSNPANERVRSFLKVLETAR